MELDIKCCQPGKPRGVAIADDGRYQRQRLARRVDLALLYDGEDFEQEFTDALAPEILNPGPDEIDYCLDGVGINDRAERPGCGVSVVSTPPVAPFVAKQWAFCRKGR